MQQEKGEFDARPICRGTGNLDALTTWDTRAHLLGIGDHSPHALKRRGDAKRLFDFQEHPPRNALISYDYGEINGTWQTAARIADTTPT